MRDTQEDPIPDAQVFDLGQKIYLADVLTRCEAELTGTALRDTRSAFRLLAERAGIDLAATLARPQDVRPLLERLAPAPLGISPKRLENIRSLVRNAVRRFGMARIPIAKQIPLATEWQELLTLITQRAHRWALSRLAAYCTVKRIGPHAVSCEKLIGFQAALEAEALSKNPANLRKHTIAVWNMCRKRVPGWPDTHLAWPLKVESYMLPLESFPEGFRRDVADWISRMSNPDPLDPTHPIRALRPDTLKRHVYDFRRLGSALVRQKILDLSEVDGFHVFYTGDHFRLALRPFKGRSSDYMAKMASLIRQVAAGRTDVTEAKRKEIDTVIARLATGGGRRMGDRNRNRLKQFDDPDALRRLYAFPAEERDRALKLRNPLRRARGIERALAISLQIFLALRVKNLRSLRLETNLRRVKDRVYLDLAGAEMKTHAELNLELPPETVDLLDLFLAHHRAVLPNADGPFLFPGASPNTPRSYSAMRDLLTKELRRRTGIVISPHLYRHILAKVVAERAPEALTAASRVLGHKSVDVTFASYLGTEGPAAGLRVAEILRHAAKPGRPT